MNLKEQIDDAIMRGQIEEALNQTLDHYKNIKEKKSIYKILLKLKSDYSLATTERNKNLIDADKYERRISIISDKLINLSYDEYVDKLLKIIFLKRVGMISIAFLLLLLGFFAGSYILKEEGIKFKKPRIEKEELVFDFFKFDPEEKIYIFSIFVLDEGLISLGAPALKEDGIELPYKVSYDGLQNPLDVFYKPKVKMTFPDRGNYQLVFALEGTDEGVGESALLDQLDYRFENTEGELFNFWRHGLYLPNVRRNLFFSILITLIFTISVFFVIHLRTSKS